MELEPDNQRRALFLRVSGSVAIFTVFVVLAVAWVITQDPTLKWALFIPLVLSVLILPRNVTLDDVPEESITRFKLWLSYVRLVYFALALFVMLGLPEILY